MEVRPALMERIRQRQKEDAKLLDIFYKVERSEPFPCNSRYSVDERA